MAFHSVSTLSSSPGRIRRAPRLEQRRPRFFDGGRPQQLAPLWAVEDVAALEVAFGPHAPPLRCHPGELRPEALVQLVLVPEVETPLLPLRVGILRRGQAAPGQPEVAQHVGDDLVEHLAPAGVACQLPGVEIDAGQERLVVEHLLEVRDEPLPVHRVPGETPSHMVPNPPAGHRLESGLHDVGAATGRGARPHPRRAPAEGGRAGAAGGTSAPARSRRAKGRTSRSRRAAASSRDARTVPGPRTLPSARASPSGRSTSGGGGARRAAIASESASA